MTDERFVLDCSDCVGDETERCDDCLVRVLVDRVPGTPVTVEEAELRAIRVLAEAGLVPEIRHLRAVG